jgi:hypothetical protein
LGIQEIALKSGSLGENGPLFNKLIDSVGLAFTWQLENVMKRVALGAANKKPVYSGTYKLTQNPGESNLRGFAVLACIHGLLRHQAANLQFSASNHSTRASSVNPGVAPESQNKLS